jgi:hypothetical protein
MYMVVVKIDTPGWHASKVELTTALNASVTGLDRLQHVYLEAHADRIAFSLYLQTPDKSDAAVMADQLCRRTMATVAGSRHWSVSLLDVGP